MNQTEKVARWLFENEQERMDGDDWDSIQGRPLWEKVVKRYLAKAKDLLGLIDQQEEPVVERLKEALITIADRLEDAGCQCDASDEYVYRCNLCVANDALKSNRSTLNTDKV